MRYKPIILLMSILMITSINMLGFTQEASLLRKLQTKVKKEFEKEYSMEEVLAKEPFDTDLYDVLASINVPTPSFVYGNYFIFLYFNDSLTDRVQIAFEHEQYSQLYNFIKIKENPMLEVYMVSRTHENQNINYRLIINGFWTIDYNNPKSLIDSRGIHVSTVFIPRIDPFFLPSIIKIDDATMRFYLYVNRGKTPIQDTLLLPVEYSRLSERKFFLSGSMSNWDPFLIEMQPVGDTDNLFFVDLPIREGLFYYYYQAGGVNFLDPKNRVLSKRFVNGEYVNTFLVYSSINDTTGAKSFEISTTGTVVQ